MALWVVRKVPEDHPAFVLVMGADRDARNLDVTKVLRAELPFARPTEGERGASTWVVLKVLRAKLTFALLMVVAGDASFQEGVPRRLVVSQASASDMVEERGVR